MSSTAGRLCHGTDTPRSLLPSPGTSCKPQALPAANPRTTESRRRRVRAFSSTQNSAVNAATLESTETDLSAELKDVLSKVKPKVLCLLAYDLVST